MIVLSKETLEKLDLETRSLLEKATFPLPIQYILDGYDSGDINIPYYQRGLVWSSDQKIKLIENILANKFIPPVILHVNPTPTRQDALDMLDGLQRITTIYEYCRGTFKSKDLIDFKNLLPEEQKKFRGYSLSVQYFYGTTDEAAERFSVMNFNSKTLQLGEVLRGMKGQMPGWEILKTLSNASAFKMGITRAENWKWAAYLLMNSGDTVFTDTRKQLTGNLAKLTEDEMKDRLTKLEMPLRNAEEILRELEKLGTTKRTKYGTLACQIAVAYRGAPRLTNAGAKIVANSISPLVFDVPKGIRKSGIHPLNFQSEETKNFVAVLKSHLLDEAVFCDPIRYPNDTLKDEIRERFKGLCSEGNHIISPGEEEFHHVKQYQEGGRTNAQNLILLCRKHHQVETKNNISKTAGAS
jgi:hypothetical protein